MEMTPQPTSRRAGLEAKIKALEEEKAYLQREVARIKEMLTTAALEKKARVLEGEVAQLKSVKTKLEEQLSSNPQPAAEGPAANTTQARPVQKQPSGQNPPVRYGTWSKLPLS